MEFTFVPEFTDSETLVLGYFPQMPSSNAGLSGARLKQICCTELYSISSSVIIQSGIGNGIGIKILDEY
jgi:hypothetical protein